MGAFRPGKSSKTTNRRVVKRDKERDGRKRELLQANPQRDRRLESLAGNEWRELTSTRSATLSCLAFSLLPRILSLASRSLSLSLSLASLRLSSHFLLRQMTGQLFTEFRPVELLPSWRGRQVECKTSPDLWVTEVIGLLLKQKGQERDERVNSFPAVDALQEEEVPTRDLDLSSGPTLSELWTRLPSLSECILFVSWVFRFLFLLVQGCLAWVVFFKFIIGADSLSSFFIHLSLWTGWVYLLILGRDYCRKASAGLRPIYDHAELFIVVSLLMVICNNVAFFFHVPRREVLFDFGHFLVPELPRESVFRKIGEGMTSTLPILCAVLTMFQSAEGRVKSFCDFFRIASIVYLLRAFTVFWTSLPGPAPHCRDLNTYRSPSGWLDMVTNIHAMYGHCNTCGDLIFSGHTAFTLTAALLLGRKLDRSWRFSLLRWLGIASYQGTVLFLIVAGRKHYTVDVVLGVIVTFLVFFHFEDSWTPHWAKAQPQQARPVSRAPKSVGPLPSPHKELTLCGVQQLSGIV